MKRRAFVGIAGLVLLVNRGVAQQRGKVVRIGLLTSGSTWHTSPVAASFRDELRKLGWIEGKNYVIEFRFGRGDPKLLPGLLAELAHLKVDIIVVSSTPAALAAKSAISNIPVVFSMVSDPVASGVVASLARPGGNLTGWSNMLPETSSKLLELLKEAAPKASRIAVLYDPANPGKLLEIKVLQRDAQRIGVNLRAFEVRSLDDIKSAFSAMTQDRVDGLVTLQDAITGQNRQTIVELANKARLPTIYQVSEFVEAGGLMSYGMNMVAQWRRSAYYVDKILRGAKPSDLPVEQPMTFEFVVNTKTAKALGVMLPPSILVRADRVIE